MFTRHIATATALLLAGTAGCVSSKSESVEQGPESCAPMVERWAAGAPGVQGQPQVDGGVIFTKPGVDSVDLFVVVSPKFLPQVRQSVDEGQKAKTIGLSKEGVCVHPQNGFTYHTLQFRITPPKQSAFSGT